MHSAEYSIWFCYNTNCETKRDLIGHYGKYLHIHLSSMTRYSFMNLSRIPSNLLGEKIATFK